ncbi:MAG TPA: hypothetical protein VN731_10245 [Rhodanobacter sp.]|nr:hypothetical protein [Rhodanobacter sp.]
MASIFTSTFDKPIRVRRGSADAQPWQAIRIESGDAAISLSREESVQLEADLHAINTEATPVDAGAEA